MNESTPTQQPQKLNILLIGDICIDEYVEVTAGKKNPESNAPLYQHWDQHNRSGMAGNVYKSLRKVGLKDIFFLKPPYPHTVKTRYIEKVTGTPLFRIDHDQHCEPCDLNNINYSEFDCVVISDYNKGFVTDKTITTVLNQFCGIGPVFLDTKKPNLADFSGAIIKVNQHEFANSRSLPKAGLIVTMGSAGCSWNHETYRSHRVKCVDPCGAGDAFLVGLVYGYARHKKINDSAIRYAVVNSGLSTTRVGCYQPSLEELESEMCKYEPT